MEDCTKLVLYGQSSFKFVRSLLENHVENIMKVGGSEQAQMYQARIEPLGSYSVELQNLESANLVATTQLVLGKLRAEQARLREEAERKIA